MISKRPAPPLSIDPIFVGFAGRMGSGKTLAATYMSLKYGFQYVRYSQVLQEWASSPSDRNRLQQRGWEVMAGGSQAELNARLLAKVDRSRSAAIDGLRHIIDLETLSTSFGASFEMIFLEAERMHRFERLQSRYSTVHAFDAVDSHPVEGNIGDLKARAKVVIENDGTPSELYNRLDAWFAAHMMGDRR